MSIVFALPSNLRWRDRNYTRSVDREIHVKNKSGHLITHEDKVYKCMDKII